MEQLDLIPQPQAGPVPPVQLRCSTCVFFLAGITNTGADEAGGLCRRNVPLIVPSGWAIWPAVKTTDWCGEWKNVL